MSNTDRYVLVTGCSTGIGYCLARGLSARGHRIIASCRADADVERLSQEGIQTIRVDLADERNVDEAVERVRELSGGNLYGLINNGAYGQPGAMIDISREVLREQFETNVFGTQQLTNGLLPMMLENRAGRVVQISSVLGFICLRFRGPYNASKYALEALTDTMRLEHRGSGVHFVLVEPGPIRSRFRENALKKYLEHIAPRESMFRSTYVELEKRMHSTEDARYTLPPEAVLKAVVHALESPRPRIRYPVTFPTRVMAILKRLLTDRRLDAFLDRQSEGVIPDDGGPAGTVPSGKSVPPDGGAA